MNHPQDVLGSENVCNRPQEARSARSAPWVFARPFPKAVHGDGTHWQVSMSTTSSSSSSGHVREGSQRPTGSSICSICSTCSICSVGVRPFPKAVHGDGTHWQVSMSTTSSSSSSGHVREGSQRPTGSSICSICSVPWVFALSPVHAVHSLAGLDEHDLL